MQSSAPPEPPEVETLETVYRDGVLVSPAMVEDEWVTERIVPVVEVVGETTLVF